MDVRSLLAKGRYGNKRTTTTANDSYEKKRKRGFVQSWTKEFVWLRYDEAKNHMFCHVCRRHNPIDNSPFVSGTQVFRKDPIRSHLSSKLHIGSMKAQAAADQPDETPMAKAMRRLNKAKLDVMRKFFNTAFYIAKEELPLAKFSTLCKLQVKNGIALSENTYMNDHACHDFIHAIADTERDDTESSTESSRFVSVLSDGSTDSGILEQEVVYVRLVEKTKPVTKMVKCQEVKYGHATGILEAIDTAMKEVGIEGEKWRQKVVCANFDGAAVMMGENAGVAAKLRNRIPHLIVMHCIAHKLELAVLDVVKNVPYLNVFEETLKSIFKFYYYSTKKRRELKEIGELMEQKLAHFSGLKSTRWLPSRLRCLTAVKKNLTAVITHLENVGSSKGAEVKPEDAAKARGIVSEMKTQKFVQFLHFMLDYSTIMAKCSTQFQFDNMNITRARYLVEGTTADLLRLKTTPGQFQQELQTHLHTDEDGDVSYDGARLVHHRRPHRLAPGETGDRPAWETEFVDILTGTIRYLDKRFANFKEKPLSLFAVFDPCLLPHNREALAQYGHEEIKQLVEHYRELLTVDEIREIHVPGEWTDLKIWMSAHRGENSYNLFPYLLAESPENLQHIIVFLELLLTISPSTAICERGFSCMNRVKTTYRTSLKSETLNDLMQLSTNGCTVSSFCPDRAVNHWFTSGKGTRHLRHKTPARQPKTQDRSSSPGPSTLSQAVEMVSSESGSEDDLVSDDEEPQINRYHSVEDIPLPGANSSSESSDSIEW